MTAITVVLVDDSADYVAAVKSWLDLWPELRLVGVAGNGEEAIRIVGQLRPDLVLMDVSMPGINGFETVKRLKRLAAPPVIIMLTIEDDAMVRYGASAAGADDFVPKTALTTALLSSIARLFPETAAKSSALSPSTASLSAQVVGVAPMLVVSVSLGGIVLFANRAVSEATGYAARELVGQNWWALLRTPAYREQLDDWLSSGHADPLEVDMTLTMRSGDTRLISWRLTKTRNARGEIAEVLLVGADVTGRAWTEQALQRFANDVSAATGARFFELLVEYVSSCLGFDFVVVGELESGGAREVRTIAAFPPSIMPDEFAQTIAGTPCERVAAGEFLTFGTGLKEAFPCAVNIQKYDLNAYVGAPLVASDGRVIGLICGFGHEAVGDQAVAEMMLRIVAGRAAAELERELAMRGLARSEALFRGLVEHTQDVVALIDAGDAITYASPAAERLFGHAPADTIGMKVIDLVHPADQAQVQELLDLKAAATDPRCLVQARIRHADGTWREVESSVAEHFDATGQRFRVVTTRDLTQRRRLEEHLQQAQKTEMIGRLAAGIAHDFGNILMVIRSHADILELKIPEPDARHVYVDAIQDAVSRGTGLARQLLAFNRQRIFEPRRFDLATSIEQMTSLLRRLVGAHVRLVTTLAPDSGIIVADPTQVEQVILNLLVNSRDAMPDGGEIRIETFSVTDANRPPVLENVPDGYICLSVTDTGCGIPAEVQGRIFDPLFTTKEEGQGTGLGLATVQGIVTRHRGTIEVDSKIGEGTTFRVYLPREQPAIGGVGLAGQADGVV
jgi:PAS domain S-box-containing protein